MQVVVSEGEFSRHGGAQQPVATPGVGICSVHDGFQANEGRLVDALAHRGDEGRGTLR